MNRVPTQAMLSEPGPQIIPTIAPSTSAKNMRFQSAISNQIATIFVHHYESSILLSFGDPQNDSRTIKGREI